ncbi:MAG: DUF4199 domain-containing protein [Bacteroidia bacterium]|nr:DUF4199 domain-containing protein [Bacteroidia bacterium]
MENQNKWQLAAVDGLVLSSITIIATLASSVLGNNTNIIVSMVLWVLKFGGSLYLLYYLMRKYSNTLETISYGQSFGYGFLVCLFSSIVCACFAYISMEFIFPEQTQIAIQQTKQLLVNYPEEQRAMLIKILDNYTYYMLFGQLIYLTIFGAIASSITANYTKKTNPFQNSEISETDNNQED